MVSPAARLVPTPLGDSRVTPSLASRPRATLVLGHGAGGGIEAPDLVALARHLSADGVTVLRVEQPWRVRGGRVAPPPPRLDVGWLATLEGLRALEPAWLAGPLLLGGRSAGARVACRTAVTLGAVGVVALAFPLHLPGRPERSRAGELTAAGVPVLVVQGERDAFGGPEELPAGLPAGSTVHVVPGADHGLKVARAAGLSQAEAMRLVVEAAGHWLDEVVRRAAPG